MGFRRMKIGLITPYTGGNLGDAAIQHAVITNIQNLVDRPDIVLFTLDPESTTRIHRVPSYPITALYISSYSTCLRSALHTARHGANSVGGRFELVRNFRQRLRRLSPGIFAVLSGVISMLRWILKLVPVVLNELRHLAAMRELLKDFDLLIVSGGGQIDEYWGGPFGQPYVLWKWSSLAHKTKTRFVFLSVGVCTLSSALGRFFMARALKGASYRSYRDARSKELLQRVKCTHADLVLPDLAFSYPLDESTPPRKAIGNRQIVVGVSPIAYLLEGHWPKTNVALHERYYRTLHAFIEDLTRRGISVVLFTTDEVDRLVVNRLADSLEVIHSSCKSRIRVSQSASVDDLFREFQQFDYVVASRLHGVILSHLALLPVLALSYDRKVDTHMAEMNQSQYCLNIHTSESNHLLMGLEALTANAEDLREALRHKTGEYRSALRQQYRNTVGIACNGGEGRSSHEGQMSRKIPLRPKEPLVTMQGPASLR